VTAEDPPVRRRGRVNGGRVEAWKAALGHVNENRRFFAQLAGIFLAAAVIVNLPIVPGSAYSRGGATGMLITAFCWLAAWAAWVSSGLAFRIQGTFAEQTVTETMRKSRHVYDVIASLKFGREDVDQVLVSPSGVVAVETKWRSRPPSEQQIEADADQASRAARSVRNTLGSLQTTGLPPDLVTAALVICGPGRRGVRSRRVETGLGPVDVISHSDLDRWLDDRRHGLVGPDFANALAAELHRLARDRDREAVTAGWLVRWLARER
jgi:hypothetical protein